MGDHEPSGSCEPKDVSDDMMEEQSGSCDLNNMYNSMMMYGPSGSCNLIYVYGESIYPLDSGILFVPLNVWESKCWLEFKNVVSWRRHRIHANLFEQCTTCRKLEEEAVELDHPVVPVVSNFAISAFNKLYSMYVKKGDDEYIYEAEVIKVRYLPHCYGYSFFITIEALEENVAAVYEAVVLCHCDDGRRTLLKLTRSTRPVVCTMLQRKSNLSLENAVYVAVKEEKKAIKDHLLKLRCKDKKGKKKSPEHIRLKKQFKDMKGFVCAYNRFKHLVNPISWKFKDRNQDYWFVPNKITGLHPRSNEHSCGGFDYYNPLTVFSRYM